MPQLIMQSTSNIIEVNDNIDAINFSGFYADGIMNDIDGDLKYMTFQTWYISQLHTWLANRATVCTYNVLNSINKV